ncbi:hypothetical protein QZH41_010791 [Actinostola sp. cb2023]|nr:hypothetical protein QZH41_010791 [Actinostola sp. cb2023]
MNALNHWKLDGSDKDVVLYGGASYKKVQYNVSAALNLPGTAGSYATTPAVAIQSTSLTIAFWVKLYSSNSYYLYSYWLNPYIFNIGVRKASEKVTIIYQSRKKSNTDLFIARGGNVILNQWTHVAVSWDRMTKQAKIFQDGIQIIQVTSAYSDLDLPNNIRSYFDVGFKRDSQTVINGAMRELVVFNRPLTSQEVMLLKDSTAISGLAKSLGAWVGPTHHYINWAPVLQSNSNCVSARAWEPYQLDKVQCSETMEFICKKRFD